MAKKSDTQEGIGSIFIIIVGIFVLVINCFIFIIDFVIFIIDIFKKNKIPLIKFVSYNPFSNNDNNSNQIKKMKSESKEANEELERKMDAYELEEFEKELVRKGEYDPEDFETDGALEDNDYYYEDDN